VMRRTHTAGEIAGPLSSGYRNNDGGTGSLKRI
jgi:hypothetical protein